MCMFVCINTGMKRLRFELLIKKNIGRHELKISGEVGDKRIDEEMIC